MVVCQIYRSPYFHLLTDVCFRAGRMPLHGVSASQLIAAGREYYEKLK